MSFTRPRLMHEVTVLKGLPKFCRLNRTANSWKTGFPVTCPVTLPVGEFTENQTLQSLPRWQAIRLDYNCRMRTSVVLMLSMVAGVLSAPGYQGVAQETQVRGYWTDPATGLMWAGRDNGKDVNW